MLKNQVCGYRGVVGTYFTFSSHFADPAFHLGSDY